VKRAWAKVIPDKSSVRSSSPLPSPRCRHINRCGRERFPLTNRGRCCIGDLCLRACCDREAHKQNGNPNADAAEQRHTSLPCSDKRDCLDMARAKAAMRGALRTAISWRWPLVRKSMRIRTFDVPRGCLYPPAPLPDCKRYCTEHYVRHNNDVDVTKRITLSEPPRSVGIKLNVGGRTVTVHSIGGHRH
jgi:hypothetical protein